MSDKRIFEILDSLPTYGPLYVPVTADNKPYYSEGFVVRFFKSNGDNWVANFQPGWTKCKEVFDFPDSNRIIVIAGGLGYVMQPDNEKPINTFGVTIDFTIRISEERIIATDNTDVREISSVGEVWRSPRISWDGIKDIKIENEQLTGLSFDPMDTNNEWIPFSIDLKTKEIQGGSYRRYYTDSGQPIERNKWWKVW